MKLVEWFNFLCACVSLAAWAFVLGGSLWLALLAP